MNRKKVVLLFAVIVVIAAYITGGGDELLNPAFYQAKFQQSPLLTAAIFFMVFLLGTALSLPVTGILTVSAGIIFGHLTGVAIVLLACSSGGTIAYLVSRYVLHDIVQQRFAVRLAVINKGVEAEGAFYLFSLRMVPVIPFWLLNLLMGMTPISVTHFFLSTLFGMLPITLILVHFGTQLGTLESFTMAEIFTPGLLLSLTLLAIMPFLAKGIVAFIRRAKLEN